MSSSGPPELKRFAVVLRVCLFGILLVGVAVMTGALYLGVYHGFSLQAIKETILSWGAWGVLASIGLMILHSFVPFPAEFLAIANGMFFGPFWGTVITWIGAMLGAVLAFGVARVLGRPFVETMVARKNWHILDEWTATSGWQVLLLSRFIPVIAFNLINYAAGLTRISWWTFVWATGIGILPLTTLMVVMGDYMEAMAWEMWILLGAGGLILWFVFRRKFQLLRGLKS